MKKILLYLLLACSISTFAQAEFPEGIQVTNVQDNTALKVNVQNATGVINWKYLADFQKEKAILSTGLLKNGLISANGDPTKFNITAGIGIISNFDDPENPTSIIVNFPAFTGITPTYLLTGTITYIAINSMPAVVMQATPFTPEQRRSLIVLGAVIHSNLTTINVLNNISAPTNSGTNQLHDFIEAVGALNLTGNKYSANGANLQLNKSAGLIFKLGSNFANDWKNPHELAQTAGTSLTFRYRTQNGTEGSDRINLDPALYDLNNVLTSVPNNKFTIQTVTMFQSGLTRIQYGQNVYDDLATAKNAVFTRNFVLEPNSKENGIIRAYIIMRNTTTSLQTIADADILEAQKFGGVASGGVALTLTNIVSALGYTPENVANKQNSLTPDGTGTKYPTIDAVNSGLALKVTGTNSSDFYRNIYYMGDSLTEDGKYIYQISTLLGVSWFNYNQGLSGDTTTGMLARFATDIPINRNPSHVVILGGTNDVSSLIPASTIQANLQAMYTYAKNAGIKVIAVTITPRTTTAPQLAIQQAVNTWIKTTAIDIDYIVDPYVTLADPSNPTQLLPAYTTDGLHMTTLGYTTLGTYIYNNATWTAKENNYNLKIDVKGYAAANQELYTYSDPTFNTINNITVGRGGGNVVSNMAVGRQALALNTYGRYNVAIGNTSLTKNTYGFDNVGIGHQALTTNTTGVSNVAVGSQSLDLNTSGNSNVAIGNSALFNNTTGGSNIAIGQSSLRANTTVSNIVGIGNNTLLNNTAGLNLIAIGGNALQANTNGSGSVAIGVNSLVSNTTGGANMAMGLSSLTANTGGNSNIGIGQSSLQANTNGSGSVALGTFSLMAKSSGDANIAIGTNSGRYIADIITPLSIANNSIFIGQDTRALANSSNNEIVIGTNNTGAGDNSVTLGNPSVTKTVLRGNVTLGLPPTTSVGTYDFLTRNTSTGVVEKVTSASVAATASPTFTGDPKAPTPTLGDNDTSVATTAFVQSTLSTTIAQTITNGVTTSAPSQDAVFDALALKANVNYPAAFTGSAVSAPLGFIGTSFTTGDTGGGLFAPNNGPISFTANNPSTPGWSSNSNISATFYKTAVYTVATLPTTGVTTGTYATVSDATAPTYLGALTGGGSVVCPVFYNGTIWVSH